MAAPQAKLLAYIEAEIDRLSGGFFKRLHFAPVLEQQFEQHYAERRARQHVRISLLTLLFFDLFLVGDWYLIRAHFTAALIVRIGIITPVSLLLIESIRENRSRFAREFSAAAFCCLLCLATLYLSFGDERVFSRQSEPTVLLILIVLTGLLRVEPIYALGAILLCTVANTAWISSQPWLSREDRVMTAMPMLAAAVLMMLAGLRSARALRHSYLLQRRGEMQSELLARTNHELRKLSERDELTGIHNRYSFEREMAVLYDEAETAGRALSIIMVDVDYFKSVNDMHGHVYGDRVLQRVASLLQQALRAERDFLARYGGEEFVVLLPETDHNAALKVAERIRTLVQVAGSPALGGSEVPGRFTTVSCGIATAIPSKDLSARRMIEAADHALYQAKADGRNCTRYAQVEFTGADRRIPQQV